MGVSLLDVDRTAGETPKLFGCIGEVTSDLQRLALSGIIVGDPISPGHIAVIDTQLDPEFLFPESPCSLSPIETKLPGYENMLPTWTKNPSDRASGSSSGMGTVT